MARPEGVFPVVKDQNRGVKNWVEGNQGNTSSAQKAPVILLKENVRPRLRKTRTLGQKGAALSVSQGEPPSKGPERRA